MMKSKERRIDPFIPLLIIAGLLILLLLVLFVQNLINYREGQIALLATTVATGLLMLYARWLLREKTVKEARQKISDLEGRVNEHPQEPKYIWDLASARLDDYFDRNLYQIKSIFWMSILVMIIGFWFIIFGIVQSRGSESYISYVSGAAGVITEFIGATFMVLYRSTLSQAQSYVNKLAQINTVGMAVQILGSISDKNTELRDKTKADVVRILAESLRRPESSDKT